MAYMQVLFGLKDLLAEGALPTARLAVSDVDLVRRLALDDFAAVAAWVLLVAHRHVLLHRLGHDPALLTRLPDRVATLFDVVIQLEPLQVDGRAPGHRAREVEQLLPVDVSHVVQHWLKIIGC